MSAFLCQEHHIAYLAQYYAKDNSGRASDVAEVLARANLASLCARYGDDDTDDASGLYIAECRRLADSAFWHHFEPSQVINSARCFDYQACEVNDWEHTRAAEICQQIISDAVRSFKKDSDIWGAPEPYSGTVIKLSDMMGVRNG